LFLRAILGPFWIIALHFQAFRCRQIRKMTNEMHQLPAVLPVAMICADMIAVARKRRHAGEPDAVFDNPEQLAVAQLLGLRFAQVRRLGIEAIADWRIAAAIVPMTNRT